MAKSLKFYNVKLRKSFNSTKYKVVTKKVKGKNRKFAVATNNGTEAWRVLPLDF